MSSVHELFAVCVPGLEDVVAAELQGLGYTPARTVAGGVELHGSWADIAHINLWSRCAGRLLVRAGAFRTQHLAELRERSAQNQLVAVLL